MRKIATGSQLPPETEQLPPNSTLSTSNNLETSMPEAMQPCDLAFPLYRTPRFARQIRERTEQTGSVTAATADLFRQANITIQIEGERGEWFHPGKSALYIGDHRSGIESLALLAVLGETRRDDIHFIAKPHSMQSALRASFGEQAAAMTLPVVPRSLASDRRNIWNRDLYWRLFYLGKLPTLAMIKQHNQQTLARANSLLVGGQAVTIYPTGCATDASASSWQQGVGRIIAATPIAARKTIGIVPFMFDNLSRSALLRSLASQSCGRTPKPRDIIFRVGRQATLHDIVPGQPADPIISEITRTVKQYFIRSFHER